jgi:hypothetical protein
MQQRFPKQLSHELECTGYGVYQIGEENARSW